MKKYKSNEELIDHLISKGIIVENKKLALKNLERYTYYAIINTYKEVFINDDKYINGVTFEEIFALYDFDKNLKSIFLKYSLEIETIVKSLVANMVSKKYGIEEYLKYNCFDKNADTYLIESLVCSITKEIKQNYGKHLAITHYKDKYGFIPPFVLVKIITIGQISRYYGLLKQEDRQAISKYFKVSDKLLKQILINLTLARNISAHNDRLYTFRSKFLISFKLINNNYKNNKSTNLYMLIRGMKFILDNKKYKQFEKQVNSEINKLSKKIKSINIENILNIMGFPNE